MGEAPKDVEQTPTGRGKPAPSGREARLKAALKANLARRKGQARARAAEAPLDADETDDTDAAASEKQDHR